MLKKICSLIILIAYLCVDVLPAQAGVTQSTLAAHVGQKSEEDFVRENRLQLENMATAALAISDAGNEFFVRQPEMDSYQWIFQLFEWSRWDSWTILEIGLVVTMTLGALLIHILWWVGGVVFKKLKTMLWQAFYGKPGAQTETRTSGDEIQLLSFPSRETLKAVFEYVNEQYIQNQGGWNNRGTAYEPESAAGTSVLDTPSYDENTAQRSVLDSWFYYWIKERVEAEWNEQGRDPLWLEMLRELAIREKLDSLIPSPIAKWYLQSVKTRLSEVIDDLLDEADYPFGSEKKSNAREKKAAWLIEEGAVMVRCLQWLTDDARSEQFRLRFERRGSQERLHLEVVDLSGEFLNDAERYFRMAGIQIGVKLQEVLTFQNDEGDVLFMAIYQPSGVRQEKFIEDPDEKMKSGRVFSFLRHRVSLGAFLAAMGFTAHENGEPRGSMLAAVGFLLWLGEAFLFLVKPMTQNQAEKSGLSNIRHKQQPEAEISLKNIKARTQPVLYLSNPTADLFFHKAA